MGTESAHIPVCQYVQCAMDRECKEEDRVENWRDGCVC